LRVCCGSSSGELNCAALSAAVIESRLEWWWRGENRALRKALETVHRRRCERGRGVLINRVTGEQIPNRCKSWRDCAHCAWLYRVAVARLFKQVRGLKAFVAFTMPLELGDWDNKEHIAAQARAKRRLAERLNRKFSRRFGQNWVREHNTKNESDGRLHLNVPWDKKELSLSLSQLGIESERESCVSTTHFHSPITIINANFGSRGEPQNAANAGRAATAKPRAAQRASISYFT
jgi:hypothetical protein